MFGVALLTDNCIVILDSLVYDFWTKSSSVDGRPEKQSRRFRTAYCKLCCEAAFWVHTRRELRLDLEISRNSKLSFRRAATTFQKPVVPLEKRSDDPDSVRSQPSS